MTRLSLERKEAMAKAALSKEIEKDIQGWLDAGELLFTKTLPEKYGGLALGYENRIRLTVNQVKLEETHQGDFVKAVFEVDMEVTADVETMKAEFIEAEESDGRPALEFFQAG